MSYSQNYSVEFQNSLNNSGTYPMNLLRTEDFIYTLELYRKKLDTPTVSPFGIGKGSIYFLDSFENTATFKLSPSLETFNLLQTYISGTREDPRCRYVFIHCKSSRDPLSCEKRQLLHIMSYHQVMPGFLDHIFTFYLRDHPHLQTSFRSEDYLYDACASLKLDALGRSGLIMQHCFNLIGIEYNAHQDEEWPFFFRQTAAYFSFDPIKGRSFWLILKSNAVIRRRIHDSMHDCSGRRRLNNLQTPEQALTSALYTHLIIVEWCHENWAAYVDFLEKAIKLPSAIVKLSNVSSEMRDEKIAQIVRRRTMQSRQNSGLSQNSEKSTQNKSRRGLFRLPSSLNSALMADNKQASDNEEHKDKPDEMGLEKNFSFDELQKLHRMASKMEDARLAIEENKNVLEDLLRRFKELEQSELLSIHMQIDQVPFAAFFKRTEWCIRGLDRRRAKLSIMLVDLEKVISLFNGTLQYSNMKTSEFFAQNAKETTDLMHDIAKKTKRETSSMHVITGLTLVFLPGTFAAVRYCLFHITEIVSSALMKCQTLFSSGIVSFDGDGPRTNWGDWETRWSALWLFLAVSLPLMGFVLAFWAVIHYRAQHETRVAQRAENLRVSEKGSVKETV
ncbi:hypothetical protein HD806DRAFT_128426 [Xylariaceae sp. AK1471]|nr:hypothetical protein HD806DRAFT_128426 [Xylariaceae sp. AK1471]